MENPESSPEVTNQMLREVASSVLLSSTCIKSFSQQLREAYYQDESRMTNETMKYRSILYSECVMYGSKIFPKTVKLIEDVKEMLETYLYVQFAEFAEDIEEIRDDCLKFSKIAKDVQIGHTFVLTNLKSLDNEMQMHVTTLKNLEAESRVSAAELRERGEKIKQYAKTGLVIAPVLLGPDSGIAVAGCTLAIAHGERQVKEAKKREDMAESNSYNASILNHLICSLQEFSQAIDLVAKFISLMELELRQLSKVGVGQEFKKRHYQKMKGKAGSLVESCNAFLTVQPSIESDLLSVKQRLELGFEEQWVRRSNQFQQSNLQIEELD